MKYTVDSNSMKKIDQYSIDVIRIPALVLMERAALEVSTVIKNKIKNTDRILAVCGPGNNGGDGLAAARILYLQGFEVAVLFLGDVTKATDQTKRQLEIVKNLGMKMENNNKLHEYNIIIDAIFGIGLTRPVTGEYEYIINEINGNDNLVFSVDIPSGISADNGKIMNSAVKADHTIAFGYMKVGMLLYPGAEYAGDITIADIGFPQVAAENVNLNTFYYGKEDLKNLPKRMNYSNKGTYGKVLIIAGCKGMSGAAYLSALAAYRTGAGLVKVLTSSDNRIILQTSLPEALFASYDDVNLSENDRKEQFLSSIHWASVIVIGPGLGKSSLAKELLQLVVEEAKVPIIIDADGINILASEMDDKGLKGWDRRDYLAGIFHDKTIFTPHLKELSRLFDLSIDEIINNLIDSADQCSYNNKLIYAIKDARSIVAYERQKYINISGNNGMSTGGSGDVLTGMIAALIAQGLANFDAVCLAMYIHGLAGDYAANSKGQYSLIARDIVNFIEEVISADIADIICRSYT